MRSPTRIIVRVISLQTLNYRAGRCEWIIGVGLLPNDDVSRYPFGDLQESTTHHMWKRACSGLICFHLSGMLLTCSRPFILGFGHLKNDRLERLAIVNKDL